MKAAFLGHLNEAVRDAALKTERKAQLFLQLPTSQNFSSITPFRPEARTMGLAKVVQECLQTFSRQHLTGWHNSFRSWKAAKAKRNYFLRLTSLSQLRQFVAPLVTILLFPHMAAEVAPPSVEPREVIYDSITGMLILLIVLTVKSL